MIGNSRAELAVPAGNTCGPRLGEQRGGARRDILPSAPDLPALIRHGGKKARVNRVSAVVVADDSAATPAVAAPGDHGRAPGSGAIDAPAAAATTPRTDGWSSTAESSSSTSTRLRTTQRGQCRGRRIGDLGASVRPHRGQRTPWRSLIAGPIRSEHAKTNNW